jgi:drug/metabolite transporter (DMT)-like permease
MSNVGLYLLCVLIWGTNWFAITFQLGKVSPEVSVAYRFALAAVVLLSYALLRGLNLRFSIRDYIWIAVQGFLLFSLTFLCIYLAEESVSSGLVATAFSFVVFLNMFGMRMFFNTPLRIPALLGATFGVIGVALIFAPAIESMSGQRDPVLGLTFALGAALSAALGNMVAIRNYVKGIPVVQVNGLGMLYGALFIAAYAMLKGTPFVFDWSFNYVSSLFYLAVVGSIIAFGAYLTLITRIGADKAGFVGVAVPVVALLVSTLFESLQWEPVTFIGLACCLLGNLLVLGRGSSVATTTKLRESRPSIRL